MLNDHYGITDITKAMKYLYQAIRVPGMQPDTRFIQNIQRTDKSRT